MKAKITYWQGVTGEKQIYTKYQVEIDALLHGEYGGLELEKLQCVRGIDVYSLRINDKTRLLFTTLDNNFCLLEETEHKYHRSKFLNNPSLLKAYLSKLANKEVEVKVVDSPVKSHRLNETELKQLGKRLNKFGNSRVKNLEMEGLILHNDDFIQLSRQQKEAMSHQFPLIVSGPPGSGKTLMALSSLLKMHRESLGAKEFTPILYVSRSPGLVASTQARWKFGVQWDENIDGGQIDGHAPVVFKTYEELIKEQGNVVEKVIILDDDEEKKTAEAKESNKQKKLVLNDIDFYRDWYANTKAAKSWGEGELWQEFRICSGYSLAGYCGLGRKQSNVEAKGEIYNLYIKFLDYVKEQGCISLEVAQTDQVKKLNKYIVLADEAQDYSLGMLEILKGFAIDETCIMYMLGWHQIIFDSKAKFDYITSLFYNRAKLNIIQLSGTYRCAPEVTRITNKLIELKCALTGGASDKNESKMTVAKDFAGNNGKLSWISTIDEAGEKLKEMSKRPNLAVITLPEFVEEVKALGINLVFTVEEIKGLEYKIIVLWRLFDSDEARKAAHKLKFSQLGTSLNRPKQDKGDDSFVTFGNKLITATSRATDEVMLVQEKNHLNAKLLDEVLSIIESLPSNLTQPKEVKEEKEEKVNEVEEEKKIKAEWEAEVRRLIGMGNLKHAESIYVEQLKYSKAAFTRLVEEVTRDIHNPNLKHNPLESEAGNSPTLGDQKSSANANKEVPKKIEVVSTSKKAKGKKKAAKKAEAKVLVAKDSNSKPSELSEQEANQIKILWEEFDPKRLLVVLRLFAVQGTIKKLLRAKVSLSPTTHGVLIKEIIQDEGKFKIFVNCILNDSYVFTLVVPELNNLCHSKKNKEKDKVISTSQAAIVSKLVDIYKVLFKYNIQATWAPADKTSVANIFVFHGEAEALENLQCFLTVADLDKKDKDNLSLVEIAVSNGYVSILEKLHKWGANVHIDAKLGAGGDGLIHLAINNNKFNIFMLKKLISLGVDLNEKNKSGLTPAYLAVTKGNLPALCELKKAGVDMTQSMYKYNSSLAHIATYHGHENILDHLYKWNLNLNQTNTFGENPAFVAAARGWPTILRKLVAWEVDPNLPKHDGTTALFIAAQYNKIEIIEILIKECGVDPNQVKENNVKLDQVDVDDLGKTPFFVGLESGHINVLTTLKMLGADVNKPNKKGLSPFLYVVEKGNAELIMFLINLGCNINMPYPDGRTAFYMAVSSGNIEMVRLLASLGADKYAPDNEGFTPFLIAASFGREEIMMLLKKWDAKVNKLNINHSNARGETAVSLAVRRQHVGVLALLQGWGADFNKRDKGGHTPFLIAASMGLVATLVLLREYGADTTQCNYDGISPVGTAVNYGHLEVLKLFLTWDSNCLNDSIPWTFMAAQEGHLNMVNFLRDGPSGNMGAVSSEEDLYRLSALKANSCPGINERMAKKIQERLKLGDTKNQIALSPVDIAQVMDYKDIVAALQEKQQIEVEVSVNNSPRFFQSQANGGITGKAIESPTKPNMSSK